MNPLLAGALAELEQKGMSLALETIGMLAQDLLSGKNIVDALNDIAMALAEKQAKAFSDTLKVLGE